MKTLTIPALALLAISAHLHAAEPAALIRLYEEEILAHDLYVALGEKFPDVMPFQNIPRSELSHRESMAAVLKAEGIEAPEPSDGRRFVSEGLDETYAKWFAEGSASAVEACRAGVRLEDHDIMDLRKARAEFTAHAKVLGQLEAASGNHLRAFHRNLTARGGQYTPEALSVADFKNILDATNQGACGCNAECGTKRGRGAGGNGNGNGNGNCNGNGNGAGNGNGNRWRRGS